MKGTYPLRSTKNLFLLFFVFILLEGCAALQSDDIGVLDRKVSRQKKEVQDIRQETTVSPQMNADTHR